MEKDAVSAGFGSLVSSSEIKILLCYILKTVDTPVPGQQLANAFHREGIANYFEVMDALQALQKAGNVEYFSENDTYLVSREGAEAAETLKKSLPFTIRQRAYALTARLLAHNRHTEETDVTVTNEDGQMYITCSLPEGNRVPMSFKLMVGDEIQAQYIRERFLEDPAGIYNGLVDLLVGRPNKK